MRAVRRPGWMLRTGLAAVAMVSVTRGDTSVAASSAFHDARELLQAYEPAEAGRVHEALARGAVTFLQTKIDATKPLAEQAIVEELRAELSSLPVPEVPFPLSADVVPEIATIELRHGTSEPDEIVLFSLKGVRVLPIVAIHRVASSFELLPAETVPPPDRPDSFERAGIIALDVTGDGVNEAVATYELRGASSTNTDLYVLRWVGGTERFKVIFETRLSDWAGPSGYRFVAAEKGRDIEEWRPVMGVFDHKLLPHPEATIVSTYDPRVDRFVKRKESIEPAKTARQQVNEGERLLRQGELTEAVRAYHRAWSDTSLMEYDDEYAKTADFRGFGRLREGEVLALLGREQEARDVLKDAIRRGGALTAFGKAFLANYEGPDAAAHAWAAMPNPEELVQEEVEHPGGTPSEGSGSMGYPMQREPVLYLGEAVAAYLSAHPDAAATPDAVYAKMKGWGLETSVATAVDLDGDGVNEFLFQTPRDGGQNLWLVRRDGGRWLADDSFRVPIGSFNGTVALPKGNGLKLTFGSFPGGGSVVGSPDRVLTFREGRLMLTSPSTDGAATDAGHRRE
jgi:hypothetical protein